MKFKMFELKDNLYIASQNVWDEAKVVFREKFIVLNKKDWKSIIWRLISRSQKENGKFYLKKGKKENKSIKWKSTKNKSTEPIVGFLMNSSHTDQGKKMRRY